jgi:hypothetical protein
MNEENCKESQNILSQINLDDIDFDTPKKQLKNTQILFNTAQIEEMLALVQTQNKEKTFSAEGNQNVLNKLIHKSEPDVQKFKANDIETESSDLKLELNTSFIKKSPDLLEFSDFDQLVQDLQQINDNSRRGQNTVSLNNELNTTHESNLVKQIAVMLDLKEKRMEQNIRAMEDRIRESFKEMAEVVNASMLNLSKNAIADQLNTSHLNLSIEREIRLSICNKEGRVKEATNNITTTNNAKISQVKQEEQILADDEFDSYLENLKNKQIASNNSTNLFSKASGVDIKAHTGFQNSIQNNTNINISISSKTNNIKAEAFNVKDFQDDEVDSFLKNMKGKGNQMQKLAFSKGNILTENSNQAKIKNTKTDASNLKDFHDDEFDSFLKDIKGGKSKPPQNFGFSKGNLNQLPEDNHNNIQSDCYIPEFTCGGKKVTIKQETLKQVELMLDNIDEVEEEIVDEISKAKESNNNKTSNPKLKNLDESGIIPRPNTHVSKFPHKEEPKKAEKSVNSCNKFEGRRKHKDLENPSTMFQPNPKKAFKFENNKPKRSLKTKFPTAENLNTLEMYCICYSSSVKTPCGCSGEEVADVSNIKNIFLKHFNISQKDATIISPNFYSYQFKLIAWRYYLFGKLFQNAEIYNIKNVLTHMKKKYDIIYEKGKRSLLMKAIEKDASINKNMVLLVLNIIKREGDYEIELTDGYCSIFSNIGGSNPIKSLIEKKQLLPGIKLNIGLCKVEKEYNSTLFVHLYYNAIAKADLTSKLGICKQLYLLKNLANIRNDGGEVSMIDVIVLKKYEYFVYDFKSKSRFSNGKLEKIIEEKNFNQDENNCKDANGNGTAGFAFENCIYNFKLICVDTLLYINYLNETATCVNPEILDLSEYSKGCLKKGLKKKLMKHCTIEFAVKNINIYEALTEGMRYQLAVFNSGNNNTNPNDNKTLRLKANDSTRIIEKKLSVKKDPNILKELCNLINFTREDRDLSQLLKSNFYNYDGLSSQEFLVTGLIAKHVKISESLYIILWTKEKNFVLIKVHDDKFFDLDYLNNIHNKKSLLTLKHSIFKIVYYHEGGLLSTMRSQIYGEGFETRNVIIYMETYNYTTFKRKNDSSTMKEYCEDEKQDELVNSIIKCIS